MRSRDIWIDIAAAAKIAVVQRGLLTIARRPEARAVIEQFLSTEMGRDCRLVEPTRLAEYGSNLRSSEFAGALYSPHEIRVESSAAIPQLAFYLAERYGVAFLRQTTVHRVVPPRLESSIGPVEAGAIVICPGDDFALLPRDRMERYGLTRCKLHMMRARSDRFDARLPAIMSDLGMIRYLGYSELPAAEALRVRLQAEQGAHIDAGVHLIAVRSADGTLVVGDSHHYSTTPDPFAKTSVDELILDEFARVFSGPRPEIVERWIGTYASSPHRLMLVDRPYEAMRVVLITSGTGASTSFAIAEEVIADLFR
jgi:D-hydroxyproline dehydrogenase subunit beta